LRSSEPVGEVVFHDPILGAMPENSVFGVAVTEQLRSLGGGEIRFAVEHKDAEGTELHVMELPDLILVFQT
jgi:hypothetical protein